MVVMFYVFFVSFTLFYDVKAVFLRLVGRSVP